MNINQSIAKVSSVHEKRYFPTEQKTRKKILKFMSQGWVAVGFWNFMMTGFLNIFYRECVFTQKVFRYINY